ncbi:Reverse transcriptase, partial [Phytophthora palmivora]
MSDHEKFWVTRGDHWVPTVVKGLGRRRYLQITNHNEILMKSTEPMVDRPSYPAPRAILKRPEISQIQDRTPIQKSVEIEVTNQNMDQVKADDLDPVIGGSAESDLPGQLSTPIQEASPENRNNSPDPELGPEAHYHEGNDLYAEDVDQEMAILPEINSTTDEVKMEDIQVGDPGIQTTAEIEPLRQKIWKYRHILIGKGNALPPAARGVVCDIDVGDARPIAQRARKIAPRFREKLSELIKGLLSAKMISYSRSPWASPIVVIVKKNGVDIRLCIDYRLVNNMASAFWVVTMTDRARAISAFITPFGLFEWNRMPFGLKNAPQIYQRLIDNALYGFTRIPPPGSDPRSTDVFEVGEADDPDKPSVIGRRSYIDDILIPADSWDQLCDRVDALLGGICRSSFWGMNKVEYLGHRVSRDGLEANPKDLETLSDLAFPGSLRSMQSFLGSLNYYSRFIEDYAIYAAVLYELREVDFAAMSKDDVQIQIKRSMEPKEVDQRDLKEDTGLDLTLRPTETGRPDGEQVDPRWVHAHRAFETLKSKIASTPILRHFDIDRETVVIVYASDWAISAALVQEYDQIYYPITFVSRTLKSNELNYSPVEKEVLALLRILDLGYNMLVGRQIRVLTRYSTLAWLFRSTGLQGRLGQWAALLSPWTLEIVKCVKGEEEILG